MDNGKLIMITIIHGADTAASRKFFLDQKANDPDSLLINGQSLTLTDLVQYFEGGQLFAQTKSFFIEQLFSKKRSREQDAIINYIRGAEKNHNIFIWEDKELTAASVKAFKNAQIKIFKLPQTLFAFLENIKPGNGGQLINLFHQTIESTDTEMVFFMIIRQVRLVLACLPDPHQVRVGLTHKDEIDELRRMAPWQKQKLQSQADFFEIKELKKLYSKLFEAELGLKTGSLPMPLPQAIDFLLLEI